MLASFTLSKLNHKSYIAFVVYPADCENCPILRDIPPLRYKMINGKKGVVSC